MADPRQTELLPGIPIVDAGLDVRPASPFRRLAHDWTRWWTLGAIGIGVLALLGAVTLTGAPLTAAWLVPLAVTAALTGVVLATYLPPAFSLDPPCGLVPFVAIIAAATLLSDATAPQTAWLTAGIMLVALLQRIAKRDAC